MLVAVASTDMPHAISRALENEGVARSSLPDHSDRVDGSQLLGFAPPAGNSSGVEA